MDESRNTVLEKLRAGEVVLGLSVRMVRSGRNREGRQGVRP